MSWYKTMSRFFCWELVLLSFFVVEEACGNLLECHSDWGCSHQDILFANGSIECYGDHSCSNSNVTIDTTQYEYASINQYNLNRKG